MGGGGLGLTNTFLLSKVGCNGKVKPVRVCIIITAPFIFTFFAAVISVGLIADSLTMRTKESILHAGPSITFDVAFGIDECLKLSIAIVNDEKGEHRGRDGETVVIVKTSLGVAEYELERVITISGDNA